MDIFSRIFLGQWNQTECNVVYLILYFLMGYAFNIDGFDWLDIAVFAAVIFHQAAFNWGTIKNKKIEKGGGGK